MNNWHSIWERRSGGSSTDPLQTLIDLDGFDSGAGKIMAADWRSYALDIVNRLNLQKGQTVFEVGCGAGALLYALHECGMKVSGLDYSAPLIARAREAMPEGNFFHGEASGISTDEKSDVVIANSVFHYFPDLDYAQEVLTRMLVKSRHAVAVLEVPNLAYRSESESSRRALLSDEEYERKYEGLKHLYYAQDWFLVLIKKTRCRVEFCSQNIPNYAQNPYRFNCFIYK